VARSIFFYTDSRVLGGAENAMLMLLESLDQERWRPTLLLDDAAGIEPLLERAAELEVPVRRVPPLPLGLTGARRVPALARLLRRERPDVFHAHMSSPVACKWALAAAVLARVPAVLGTVQVGQYEPPSRSASWQLRLLARGVDRYLAVSRDIATELVERLGWPAEKIEVVYNAVDAERFAVAAPPGLRQQLGGNKTRSLVLTAARLDAQKGHPVLLEAAIQVPDAVFVLAGDGPERQNLEELAGRLGVADRVRFLGRRGDVPNLLAACDVFALPSLYEGSSLAVLEAMAAGKALVSSAIGGTDELIEDGRSGLLVPPGDPEALAGALRRLLADRELRASLAGRARERVERDLTRERMAERVEATYRQLLGATVGEQGDLVESERNARLRAADWRFLLADGELLRSWRLPRPGAARRARRRLEADGFTDVRVYWAGPLPHRPPNYWLPLDSPEAVRYLLAGGRLGSLPGLVLRAVWRFARKAGLLVPIYVVGRPPGAAAGDDVDLSGGPLLLLTGGHRSINKAVGLVFEEGGEKPTAAVKFARVAEAEPGLKHEAEVLRRLGRERRDLEGVPRLRGEGRRAGRLAVVEEVVEGSPMLQVLNRGNFAELTRGVTALLIELGRGGGEDGGWRRRLVDEPLASFERSFGPVLADGEMAAVRSLLDGLGEVPSACEHRDCSPWNILLSADNAPVLLDWESAEPEGLSGLDLVYFLANCAFVLDGAIESGRTRESYARVLDPGTPYGRVAAAAIDEYCSALEIRPEDFHRLRLLCWIVHSRSDYRHLELEAGAPPSAEALRGAMFAGLVEEEIRFATTRFGPP
jgi:glycosyltransferase involved in cell wall biosynthesis